MARTPLPVLAISLALFAGMMASGNRSAAQEAPSQEVRAPSPQGNQQLGATVPRAAESDVAQLRKEVESTEKTLSQMQKVDSKIADVAPWFAAAIAFVALFPVLLIAFEWQSRQISEKRFEDFKAEVTRSVEFAKSELEKAAIENINDRVDFIITSELRRLTQNIESDYSRNLAQVENVCRAFLENEFLHRSGSKNTQMSSAIRYMYVFRHLLVLLVAGDAKERSTALFLLSNEYIVECGPSTKTFLAALLSKLESDARFARQDIARALEVLKQQCG